MAEYRDASHAIANNIDTVVLPKNNRRLGSGTRNHARRLSPADPEEAAMAQLGG
jgi:hypothetical protein